MLQISTTAEISIGKSVLKLSVSLFPTERSNISASNQRNRRTEVNIKLLKTKIVLPNQHNRRNQREDNFENEETSASNQHRRR